MDWNEDANREVPNRAERLPDGVHTVKIDRILHGSKNGGPFVTRDNEPQVLLILVDEQGREATTFVLLSEHEQRRVRFVHLCARCRPAMDLSQMTLNEVRPKDFADPDFADTNLLGRELRVDVENVTKGDKTYTNVTFLKFPDTPAVATPASEEIPF